MNFDTSDTSDMDDTYMTAEEKEGTELDKYLNQLRRNKPMITNNQTGSWLITWGFMLDGSNVIREDTFTVHGQRSLNAWKECLEELNHCTLISVAEVRA